jgi:hypothetical protein
VVLVLAHQNLSEEEAWKKRKEEAAKDGVAPQTGEWYVRVAVPASPSLGT